MDLYRLLSTVIDYYGFLLICILPTHSLIPVISFVIPWTLPFGGVLRAN